MPNEDLKTPMKFSRYMTFERALGTEDKSFPVTFSSEQAVKRFDWRTGEYYDEILGHEPGNVDLTRIAEMGTTLLNHNPDAIVGPFRGAELDTKEHKCRGIIGFDDDEESQKIRNKVASGTLKGISVGYLVKSWEIVSAGQKSTDGRHVGPCRIARSWEPYEVSITPIPADVNVGIGRSLPDAIFPEILEKFLEQREAELINGKQDSIQPLGLYQRELEMLEAEI